MVLSDDEIKQLIEDEKPLKSETINSINSNLKFKNQAKRWEYELISESGNKFEIKIRINDNHPYNFTVILQYKDEKGHIYRLRRYNGKHTHQNKIENNRFRDFHIHKATQKYQENGHEIDGYAEVTNSYDNWEDAFQTMIKECNFKLDNRPLTEFT
ncbi:conserved hypothetical protein [Methanohalobium evestigatum Z-7303]|uniref:Uncharacterized protein n=1 Tax=Methanohalobium evestigatum (strain ATCC BAA-1072 / DSM 3721 / NBRC 107634 / OCM 161 / Z-7303) TaxID=644295 RepID=D7E6U6_METEZ|nr:hypothetical protein [Methanohalobium evestigatum]ADI73570.1 conserved hypothetical protein [Methanohalobium evestigatum Z-7303]